MLITKSASLSRHNKASVDAAKDLMQQALREVLRGQGIDVDAMLLPSPEQAGTPQLALI